MLVVLSKILVVFTILILTPHKNYCYQPMLSISFAQASTILWCSDVTTVVFNTKYLTHLTKVQHYHKLIPLKSIYLEQVHHLPINCIYLLSTCS